MQPEDMPLHDLLGVGDQAEPGPDPLRAIVARASRRRRRLVAGCMAVALVAGGAIGFAVSNHSSPAAQTSTAGALAGAGSGSGGPAAPTASALSGGSVTSSADGLPGVGRQLSRLFTRTTAGGVTLRAFRTEAIAPAALPSGCAISVPRLQVEVSTATMVGVVLGSAPATHSQPVTAVDSQVVGQPESDATAVVVVATGPTVTRVEVAFKGGAKDSMAPSAGWAVLAASAPANLSNGAAIGTLTAMNAAGKAVGSLPVTLGSEPFGLPGGSCAVPCPAAGGSTASGSGASGGSGAIARPPVICAAAPCGTFAPSNVPSNTSVPSNIRLMPALRDGSASVCASGGGSGSSGSSSSSSSRAGTAGNNAAAGAAG